LLIQKNTKELAIVKDELVLQDKQTKKIHSIEMWTDAFIVYLSKDT
jgi:hypothetical protein